MSRRNEKFTGDVPEALFVDGVSARLSTGRPVGEEFVNEEVLDLVFTGSIS